MDPRKKLDLAAVRARLQGAHGRDYWRSLDELAATPEFQDLMEREFPRQAVGWSEDEDPVKGRRNFLKLMGASLALAGLSACTRQPTEYITPYVRQPEDLIPGRPLFYATATTLNGVATGVLAESHEGRPTKIEGNPEHPATLGACDAFSQASVLQLYDPDRMATATYSGEIRSWSTFYGALRGILSEQKAKSGAGIRILTETVTSPTMADQLRQIRQLFPALKWHQWEPAGPHSARAGAVMAFGQPVNTYYDLSAANVVVSIDSDFLASGPASLRYARQFAARRRVRGNQTAMNRLYVVEPMPTPTGSKADHRLPLRAADIEVFAGALTAAVGTGRGPESGENHDIYKWVDEIGRDLARNKGASLVIAGEHQPPVVHAFAHAMNASLGNVGKTVFNTDPIEADPVDQVASLEDLVKDLDAGAVDLLLILGGNPVFNAPVELGLRDRLTKARVRAHLSLYDDETSRACQWRLPEAHYLEAWGDARAFDGTATIQQPLIQPLYGGKSAYEVLQMFTDRPEKSGREIVKDYWAGQHTGADFEVWWRRAVHDGVVANTAFPAKQPALHAENIAGPAHSPKLGGKFEVIFRPDPAIYDGRFANNGWLQETPKPMTQICWDNAVLMSVATAKKLNLKSEDEVELELNGRKVKGAIWLTPGHPDGAVTVSLGYGREKAGRVGSGVGFSGYQLRASNAMWYAGGLKLRATGGHSGLASPQGHQAMEGRAIVRAATLEEFIKRPGFAHEMVEAPPAGLTMYAPYEYKELKWGMAIDLNSCIGCKSCEVACQAENNIAVVGKEEVKRGRIMHWLRIDNYHEGSPENPHTYFQPVPCQQCENAPCEVVCPVGATVHSSEGLNDMIYNRCVGTRYCSNNCPYKVRRFNFLLFSDFKTPQLKFQRNPEVTVRSRGVMEKCTYCIQRITHARIDAEEQNRKVRDGEVLTACQQACPAEAIVFGDLNDAGSRVAKLKASQRNYGLLEELNTRPRTTYLAAVRNPNPELES
jgi:molybdopterin-containing oxidoreductase family iron-sulfur binding subunit